MCEKHYARSVAHKKVARKNEWYRENKKRILKKNKKYYEKNKKEINKKNTKYKQDRERVDMPFKLTRVLRHRLYSAMHRYLDGHKVVSAVRDLGCSMEELKRYLESKFQPGMSWSNWGCKAGQWSIDHIKPLSSFDLTNKEEALKAVHYTNLQPMWHVDNIRKGNKVLTNG